MGKFVAGSVSTQIQQNWHAWSADVRTFDTEDEAENYARQCHECIMNEHQPGEYLRETTFCYELPNSDEEKLHP